MLESCWITLLLLHTLTIWVAQNRLSVTSLPGKFGFGPFIAAHIPGDCNITAGEKSRKVSEWQLNSSHFQNICTIFGTPDIDLFASHLIDKLVSMFHGTQNQRLMPSMLSR